MRALIQAMVQVCHLALCLNLHHSKLQGLQLGTSETSKLGCMRIVDCWLFLKYMQQDMMYYAGRDRSWNNAVK